MGRIQLSTAEAPSPRGAYAQGVVAGDHVYTAGLGPLDPATKEVVGTEAGEQTRQVLRNLSAILAEAGASLADVVKVTAHLQDGERDWAAFDTAYGEFFTPPYPVRTTAGSNLGGILVEIDVVAYRPRARAAE
ncbi:MAG TPA: Rid family hydrolase [Streptosporangiaceae bacterium]|jgi:reactive intermediate/imine deaminase